MTSILLHCCNCSSSLKPWNSDLELPSSPLVAATWRLLCYQKLCLLLSLLLNLSSGIARPQRCNFFYCGQHWSSKRPMTVHLDGRPAPKHCTFYHRGLEGSLLISFCLGGPAVGAIGRLGQRQDLCPFMVAVDCCRTTPYQGRLAHKSCASEVKRH